MCNSIFNNQEAKLNIQVKNKKKHKESLKNGEYVKSKTRLKLYIKWNTNQENWITFTKQL